jgi:hypothetical protein
VPSVSPTRAALASEQLQFLRTPGLSVYVASRDAEQRPALVRGLGFRIARDNRRITVLASTLQAAEVINNVRENGVIAVVFSLPRNHATLQLKGADAAMTRVLATDPQLAVLFRDNFVRELERLGYPRHVVATVMLCPDEKFSAITFTPYAAFSQTPGPMAGQPILALR